MTRRCLTIVYGSGGKGDATPVTHEKDELWGTAGRRPLSTSRTPLHPTRVYTQAGQPSVESFADEAAEASPFGPEAHERAQTMAYERMTRIQRESPYAVEEVVEVEHVVHDRRLYVGMWVVAGVSAVSAYLTFSVACLITTCVALLFALTSTPGWQRRD